MDALCFQLRKPRLRPDLGGLGQFPLGLVVAILAENNLRLRVLRIVGYAVPVLVGELLGELGNLFLAGQPFLVNRA